MATFISACQHYWKHLQEKCQRWPLSWLKCRCAEGCSQGTALWPARKIRDVWQCVIFKWVKNLGDLKVAFCGMAAGGCTYTCPWGLQQTHGGWQTGVCGRGRVLSHQHFAPTSLVPIASKNVQHPLGRLHIFSTKRLMNFWVGYFYWIQNINEKHVDCYNGQMFGWSTGC